MTRHDLFKDCGAIGFAVLNLANIHLVLNIISVGLVILFTLPGIVIRWRNFMHMLRNEKPEKEKEIDE